MAELVEAVARAICAVEGDAWDGSVTPDMLARAALAAIEAEGYRVVKIDPSPTEFPAEKPTALRFF